MKDIKRLEITIEELRELKNLLLSSDAKITAEILGAVLDKIIGNYIQFYTNYFLLVSFHFLGAGTFNIAFNIFSALSKSALFKSSFLLFILSFIYFLLMLFT